MNVNNTTIARDSLIQMFLDATAGETYNQGRLATRQSGENTVELIAYGWNKIAEYNEETDSVTIFAGHSGNISQTVTRYVNLVREIAGKRQTHTVNVLIDAAPNVARPPESVQFIDNYVSFSGSKSPVEQWAQASVDDSVSEKVASL